MIVIRYEDTLDLHHIALLYVLEPGTGVCGKCVGSVWETPCFTVLTVQSHFLLNDKAVLDRA